jgi:SAM-dependent methyltransferase
MDKRAHWEAVYTTKAADRVSWFQRSAEPSLKMIRASGIAKDDGIIDIGGGASVLAAELLDAGFRDVSVLDIAEAALAASKARLGPRASEVRWIVADILSWTPPRRFALWHDRAVFHFLTGARDRAVYRSALEKALGPGGHLILATFAPDGPERCSGLDVHRWSPEGLAAELGPGFAPVESTNEAHVTPGGATQHFIWCRFRRVGSVP